MRYSILVLFILGKYILAENTPPIVANPAAGGGGYPVNGANRLNSNSIQVFDNDFFKDKIVVPVNNTTPKGRSYADEPDYNTETRQRALDKCESLKNRDFAKYQECYQKDMVNVKKGIQESYDEVEKRQSIPLSNTPNSLIEEQKRNPSGFNEED